MEVLKRTNTTSTEAILLRTQLRWAGHVVRIDDNHLLKAVMYGELSTRKHDKGAPYKRFKDSLKKSLLICNINRQLWETQATDHVAW